MLTYKTLINKIRYSGGGKHHHEADSLHRKPLYGTPKNTLDGVFL